MMRTKLLIGLLSTAIVGIVAGNFLCNRSGAQDAPTPASKLFDVLKKDLDAKKDVVLPALPAITSGPAPTIPSPTVVDAPTPVPVPPLPSPFAKDAGTPSFDPVPVTPVTQATPLTNVPRANVPAVEPKKVDDVAPPLKAPPSVGTPAVTPSAPTATGVVDPDAKKPEAPPPLPVGDPVPPTRNSGPSAPFPPPSSIQSPPMPPTVIPPQARQQVIIPPTPKNSPWTFQVEVMDQQTIVTGTVHKKHAFKIVCKHVHLETEKGTLWAKGSVQITGDALEGTCNGLSIPLSDDRMVLEGTAEVRIHRNPVSPYVANHPGSQFEMKGETLNLRISDLQSGKLLQTSLRQATDPSPSAQPAPMPSLASKNWSPKGKLRRTSERYGDLPVWSLEDSAGRPIARFITREGSSLSQYVGQTIAVHLETYDKVMQCVTHIAIP